MQCYCLKTLQTVAFCAIFFVSIDGKVSTLALQNRQMGTGKSLNNNKINIFTSNKVKQTNLDTFPTQNHGGDEDDDDDYNSDYSDAQWGKLNDNNINSLTSNKKDNTKNARKHQLSAVVNSSKRKDNKGFVIIIDKNNNIQWLPNSKRTSSMQPKHIPIYIVVLKNTTTTTTTKASLPALTRTLTKTKNDKTTNSKIIMSTELQRYSMPAGGEAARVAYSPMSKLYGSWNGFFNPFGQLVYTFFGGASHNHNNNGQTNNFYNYNFLFNAEQHTIFHLHTNGNREKREGARIFAAAGVTETDIMGGGGGGVGIGGPNTITQRVQLYNGNSLRQSRFNPFNPTRILIHGWLGGARANVYAHIVPQYLKLGMGNYNVFTVDWGRGAIADYVTASYRVKPVGRIVAKFIDFLQREANMRLDDLHVIGFSMGAHIAGIAGKHLQTGRLPILYALDPALPLFHYDRPEERVAITDANYVEVIHTSVGSYGYDRPLGHVDFYVNWGSSQPGCFFNECSHFRAYQVFAESLKLAKIAENATNIGFMGIGCASSWWQDMIKNRRCIVRTGQQRTMAADPIETPTELCKNAGIYYVHTNASPPYVKNHE